MTDELWIIHGKFCFYWFLTDLIIDIFRLIKFIIRGRVFAKKKPELLSESIQQLEENIKNIQTKELDSMIVSSASNTALAKIKKIYMSYMRCLYRGHISIRMFGRKRKALNILEKYLTSEDVEEFRMWKRIWFVREKNAEQIFVRDELWNK